MIGYFEFVAILLFNGMAIGERLNTWDEKDSLTVRIGMALSLGLAFNVAIALLLFFTGFKTFDAGNLAIGCIFSVVMLASSFDKKRKVDFFKRPTKQDISFFAICVFPIIAILTVYFAKNPLFPDFPSPDFQSHVILAHGLSQTFEGFATLSNMIAYYGVHFQLSDIMQIEGGEPLFTIRYAMGVITIISPYIVYLCAMRLTNNAWASFIMTAIYSLSGLWFSVVFNAGLYANFYGLIASLFLISTSIGFMEKKLGINTILLLSLAFLNAYFSHYSTFLIFPALLIYALAHFRDRIKSTIMASLIIAPIAVGLLFFPSLISALLQFRNSSAGSIPLPTWLAWIFYDSPTKSTMAVPLGLPSLSIPFPPLGYLIAEVSNDWASLLMLLLIIPYLYALIKSKQKSILAIPLIWFLTVMAISPANSAAWRFSLIALFPLTLMAGMGLFKIVPFQIEMKKFGRSYFPTIRGTVMVGAIMWLMILPLPFGNTQFVGSVNKAPTVGGSWSYQEFIGSSLFTENFSRQQENAYRAIEWLKIQDQPFTSVSVAYQPLSYSELLGGRKIYFAPEQHIQWANPSQLSLFAIARSIKYVITTRISGMTYPTQNITTVHDANLTRLKERFLNITRTVASTLKGGSLVGYPLTQNSTGYYATLAIQFDPWSIYTQDSLSCHGNCTVYHNDDVRIFCISSECLPKT